MYDVVSKNHAVSTILWICGENLQVDIINEKLGFSDSIVTLKGQRPMSLPAQGDRPVDGEQRLFDSRLDLDLWSRSLTSKQSRWNVERQLEFWIQSLYPVRSAFQEFKDMGYWSVIDCQIASTDRQLPSIQFRLTKEMQLKLSKLCLDLDFTIYRPTS